MTRMEEHSYHPSHQQIPRQSDAQLEFITYTNPNTAATASNRQRVRSQAMRHVHQQSRTSRASGIRGARRNEIELDISPLLEVTVGNYEQVIATEDDETHQAESSIHEIPPGPATTLSISRADPFFQYPIGMGHRELELYDHCEQESLFT